MTHLTELVTPSYNIGMHSNNLLRVEHLTKTWGNGTQRSVQALDDFSFSVKRNEFVVIIGPSGCGKSTLLFTIAGLEQPSSGIVYLEDKPVTGPSPDRSLIFQEPSLFPWLSVMENVEWGLKVRGLAKTERRERAFSYLRQVGLTDSIKKYPHELSGGMKRRLSLARALINQPQMLMLDEPTTGLDPQARHLMWERLQMLMQEGKSILLTTHFMDEAERLCDRLLVIDHGKKIAEGKPRDLIAQHLEPDVLELYGQGALALADEDSPLRQHAARVEISGETAFFYTSQAQPLLMALQAWPQVRSLHRPANLEDLFLKLTGRQIRENA